MPIVTGDLLSATLTGARAIFNDTYLARVEQSAWLKMVLDGRAQDSSGHESMQYGWLSSVPKMTRWAGQLELEDFERFDFTLTNHLYTASFPVDRLAFERDQLGMIPPKTRQLADEAARFPGEKIFDLVNGGGAAIGESPTFDGAAFFADRTIGDSATIDNTLATAGTSVANFRTDLAAARAQMMSFQDERGRPINVAPNVILCNPAKGTVIFEALNVGAGADKGVGVTPVGTDGVAVWQSQQGYTVIESAYVTDTAGVYFMHVSPGRAPFLYQVEVAPQLESLEGNSEEALMAERFIYKVRAVFAVGFGDPRYIVYTT